MTIVHIEAVEIKFFERYLEGDVRECLREFRETYGMAQITEYEVLWNNEKVEQFVPRDLHGKQIHPTIPPRPPNWRFITEDGFNNFSIVFKNMKQRQDQRNRGIHSILDDSPLTLKDLAIPALKPEVKNDKR